MLTDLIQRLDLPWLGRFAKKVLSVALSNTFSKICFPIRS